MAEQRLQQHHLLVDDTTEEEAIEQMLDYFSKGEFDDALSVINRTFPTTFRFANRQLLHAIFDAIDDYAFGVMHSHPHDMEDDGFFLEQRHATKVVQVISAISERDAELATVMGTDDDGIGRLTLHRATRCEYWLKLPVQLLKTIVTAYPEAVKVADAVGNLPLHYAANDRDKEIISFFLDLHPQGTSHAGQNGNLPIQIILARRMEDESGMKELLELLYQATPASILLKTSVLSSANTDAKVEWLVQKNPACCQVPDTFGNLPLHNLFLNREVSCIALEQVVNAYPEALQHQNQYGETPLHCIFRYAFHKDLSDIVKMFVKHCPEAATIQSQSGELPIHMAMMSEWDMSTNQCLDSLYGVYPDGLTTIIDKKIGNTSLHDVKDEENAIWCTRKNPELCRIANNLGELPLHIASKASLGLEALEVMAEAYPEALQIRSQHGDLPLHSSCDCKGTSYSRWSETFQKLLDLYPQAALVKNANGDLPIHLAFRSLAFRKWCFNSKEETAKLLDKFEALSPQCLQSTDGNGNTILHLADDANKIQWIVGKCPELCRISNQDGDLPLHLLKFVIDDDDEEEDFVTIIQQMIAAYPEALQTTNNLGQFPLHRSGDCRNKRILQSIIDGYPQAVSEEDQNGRLPIHCFLATEQLETEFYDYDPQCLQLLYDTYPEGLAVVDKFGNTALHLAHDEERLSWVLRHISGEPISHYNTPNHNGEYPLHLAVTKGVSTEMLEDLMSPDSNDDDDNTSSVDDNTENRMFELSPDRSDDDNNTSSVDDNTIIVNEPDTVKGNMPLHNAIATNMPLHNDIAAGNLIRTIEWLLDEHAPATQHANKEGKLPLHLFCQRNPRVWSKVIVEKKLDAILDEIIQHFPEGLTMHDQNGYLPVHHACGSGYKMSAIEKLLPPRHEQEASTTNIVTSSNKYEILPPTESGVPLLFLACEGNDNESPDALNTIFQLALLSLDLIKSATRSRNQQNQPVGRKRALESNSGSGSQVNSNSKLQRTQHCDIP